MRLVAVDRSIILPAVCSPKSRYRALLAVLKYGAAAAYARWGAEEKDLAEEFAGAEFGGPSIDSLVEQANAEKERRDQLLPGDPPDEWGMALSRPLLDSYQEIIRKHHERFGVSFPPEYVAALRQKLLLTAAGMNVVPDERALPILPITGNRDDDLVLTTALAAGAEFVVTEKKSLFGNQDFGHHYQHPEEKASVHAVTFERLAEEITESSFEFRDVRPEAW